MGKNPFTTRMLSYLILSVKMNMVDGAYSSLILFSGKELFTSWFLLAWFQYLLHVACLGYHGLHLAGLAQFQHWKNALQLVGLVTTRSSNALLVTTMISPVFFSTQMMMPSETFSVLAPTMSSIIYPFYCFFSPHIFWAY